MGGMTNSLLAPLLSEPFLDERAHHLLRALCPADKRQHLGVRLFRVAHPPGARASQHGQLPCAIIVRLGGPVPLLAVEELTRMFKKRDMPGEGCIVYVFEAKYMREVREPVEDLFEGDYRFGGGGDCGCEGGQGLGGDREHWGLVIDAYRRRVV